MHAEVMAVGAVPQQPKTEALADLLAQRHGRPIRRLLVVGCGTGREAASLRRSIGCRVCGVDIVDRFDPAAAACVELQLGDATELRFEDGSFDYVYSFHALEHIADYRRALREMRRVLGRNGGFCIGTPNRSRLVGYLGSRNTDLMTKLKWNAADWNARLRGRFRNDCGAHAGFTRGELCAELQSVFGSVSDITGDYYRQLYARWTGAVSALESSRLGRVVFPSIYFLGTK